MNPVWREEILATAENRWQPYSAGSPAIKPCAPVDYCPAATAENRYREPGRTAYSVKMQPGVPTWDEYFLEICRTVSRRSKDPHTKLGAVVVGPAHEIRATGYNSLVRGIRDDVPERLERPEKYLWMEHAERNAIYNAARHGTQMQGCTLYVELLPCMDCARAIVQAGLREVVVDGHRVREYWSEQYTPHFEHIRTMFQEAGVALRCVPPVEGE